VSDVTSGGLLGHLGPCLPSPGR